MPAKLNLELVKKMQLSMERVEYNDVLEDLAAFTGFSKEEICARAIKKSTFGFGAKGWFNEEFAYFDPKTPNEYTWFYRASQIYVFSNARRAWWPGLAKLKKEDQPILDYGAGIGQNVLELHRRGLSDSWFFEIGALQCEFFRFRMQRHGYVPKMIEPFHDRRFDPVGCLENHGPFQTVILLDVLEHVHRYDRILIKLVERLKPGGKIIEHSPFATKKREPEEMSEKSTRVHLVDAVGLKKCMAKLGMTLTKVTPTEKSGSEVREWTK